MDQLTELESLDLALNKIIKLNYSKLPLAKKIFLESNPIIKISNQKNDNRNNHKRAISYPVNPYITVELEDNSIQIYVENQLCVYLVMNKDKFLVYEGFTNIKSKSSYYVRYISKEKETRKYPGFGTIEVAGEIDDRQQKNTISVNTLYPFIFNGKKAEELLFNLHVWNNYHYDPRLLQTNIAIPILKKLTDLGDENARKVLKAELNKKKIITIRNIRNGNDNFDFDDDDNYGIV